MTHQLHLLPQSPTPPDRKQQLEQAIQQTRIAVEAALKLIGTQIGTQISAQSDEPLTALTAALTAAVQHIDIHVDDMETLAQLLSADNEELKMVAGKLRKQRDEAIRARSQVLAYLRQRKNNK